RPMDLFFVLASRYSVRVVLPAIDLGNGEGGALYRRLCDALATAIAAGELAPGARLPSERDLAEQLGVSRTTVVAAYQELEARGLVRGHVGRGTYVLAVPEPGGAPFAWRGKVSLAAQRSADPTMRALVGASGPGVISLAAGTAALDRFPADAFRELSAALLRRDPAAAVGLGPTEGQPVLRRALARREGARPEEVLVLTG